MKKIAALFAVLIVIIAISCKKKEDFGQRERIVLLKVYDIPVPEPSGLCMTFEQNGFWIVSDENSTVYRINNEGKISKKFKINGSDIEGITVIDTEKIAIVLERTREIVILDTNGNELHRAKLDLQGEVNSGLEGITYNPENGHFFLVNEKNPTLLIELDNEFNVVKKDTIDFPKDLSGIFFDASNKLLWILSDESRLVIKSDLDGNPIEEFKISVVQPEGIVIDKKGRRLYIVSDKMETLTVYEIK